MLGFLPGKQEGCSHADSGGEGNDVGDDQVALHTHHHDQEGNHRLQQNGSALDHRTSSTVIQGFASHNKWTLNGIRAVFPPPKCLSLLSISQASQALEVVFGHSCGSYQGASADRSLFPEASQEPLPEGNSQGSGELRGEEEKTTLKVWFCCELPVNSTKEPLLEVNMILWEQRAEASAL